MDDTSHPGTASETEPARPSGPSGDVTRLLVAWSEGDEDAQKELLARIYDELRRLADSYLRRERAGHTLESSDLVHEAYLRLIDQRRVSWRNRAHFFGIAAQAMRRILVDHARRRRYAKRGGDRARVDLDLDGELGMQRLPEVEALDDALAALAEVDGIQARVVEMRYFGGLTGEEIAAVLDQSVRTVSRHWRLARAWLYRELASDHG